MSHQFLAAANGQNRFYTWFEALHTRVGIIMSAPLPEADFLLLGQQAADCLAAIDRMGNRFRPDSELSQAVAAAASQPVALSPALAALLRRCLLAYDETGGYFDVTVNSPLFEPRLIRSVQLTDDDHLRLLRPGIVIDLSGMLKGYALEQLRLLLTASGIADAIVNLGNSSILALGHVPTDIPPGHCLTTSGNATAQRRHIRNPLTGEYVTDCRSVSVVTPDGIEGEIQATVTFIKTNHR